MTKDRVTGRDTRIQSVINLFPKSFRLQLNPRRHAIETFVKQSAKKTPSGARVLDAGAGPCPYKPFFRHCRYESTDFVDPDKILDFTCSLDNIPKSTGAYDAVLSTEVLEHVEFPQKVMDEMYRILKKGGKLYLTTPQGWMIHQAPYNYFYFTKYGLESILKSAGFKKYKISPMGGYFKFLADALRFNSLAEQWKHIKPLYIILAAIDLVIFKILFSFILFHLDAIDRARVWTMGYTVEATK
ncbi:MAG: class I SAM-dependent methyltransferase [Nanoarchaeota archaeon]|mgnify:CR=1 FL=1